MEENRVALVAIIVEDPNSVEALNALLHQYRQHIIGRMGLPYRERQISVISVAMDAPVSVINGLCGKLGMIPGVSAKSLCSKLP